jgi:hypothetical protein
VKKPVGAVQKHAGATEKMMMTTIIVAAAAEQALVVVEASMMKTTMKETAHEVNGVLQAEAMMNTIR